MFQMIGFHIANDTRFIVYYNTDIFGFSIERVLKVCYLVRLDFREQIYFKGAV